MDTASSPRAEGELPIRPRLAPQEERDGREGGGSGEGGRGQREGGQDREEREGGRWREAERGGVGSGKRPPSNSLSE